MGFLTGAMTSLLRGAARKPLTPKQGNKNFYKGTRTGRMGTWTTKGRFIVQGWRKRQYVVPVLSEGQSQLTPYVSSKIPEPASRVHSVVDYFQERSLDMSETLYQACLERAESVQQAVAAVPKHTIPNE
ncbi:hypothetical protein HDV03_002356 [Kappamyces sp. JEL0829]|nr:hypothetical protein HDV03_002356 [Kappamyces sp. JEL0829]